MLILGTSGETYISNGVCQCKAFEHKMPCWHRAAVQLVKRYKEASASQPLSWAEERAALIPAIETRWSAKHPRFPLGLALLKQFGTNQITDLANDMLRGILKAIS